MSIYDKFLEPELLMEAKDNYKDIENKIANAQEFKGNSAKAYYQNDTYVIVSYNTEIARIEINDNGSYEVKYFDNKKYSTTTSRLQNLIKKYYKVD